MTVSPQVPAEGIRDLEHACEVATFLIGSSWGRQNLSEGQREAVQMLRDQTRRTHVVEITRNSDTYNTVVNALAFYALACHSAHMQVAALDEIGADGMAEIIAAQKGVER